MSNIGRASVVSHQRRQGEVAAGASPAVDGRARSARRLPAFRRALLRWFDANKRDLPWRRTRDPYRIWLSEVLLQQTRVETVRAYYERFVRAFPTVRALARAKTDDVLRLWSGLGYYGRARNLHRAAKAVVESHAGRFPRTAAEVRKLPGVGRYTAAAVASIAFDEPVAALDGNIKRVLARLFAIREPIDRTDVIAELWRLAERVLDRRRPGAFNQALMELGATMCTLRNPRCLTCPVRRWCAAQQQNLQVRLPVRSARKAVPKVEAVAAAIERRGRVLMVQRPPAGLLGGLWQLPGGPVENGRPPERVLREQIRAALGLSIRVLEPLGSVEHGFTHRRLRVQVFRCERVSGRLRPKAGTATKWVKPGIADQGSRTGPVALSTLDRRILKLIARPR